MAEERDKTGRCGWIALGFMAFLLQGLLPVSLVGGVAGAMASARLFGHSSGSELMARMFVLTGMILALLVTAAAVMMLTIAVNRIVRRLFRVTYRVRQLDLKT